MTLRAAGYLLAVRQVVAGGASWFRCGSARPVRIVRTGYRVALLTVEAMTATGFFDRPVYGGMAYAALCRGKRLRLAGVESQRRRYSYGESFPRFFSCKRIDRKRHLEQCHGENKIEK